MCTAIGKDVGNSPQISHDLEEISLNSVREMLPDRTIEQACRDVRHRFRRRALTPVVMVLHMILAAIWPEDSFQASWDTFWASATSHFTQLAGRSPSSGSVAKARNRLPLALWQAIFDWVSAKAQALSEPWASWRGHRVVLVDGTCVSMPDEPELFDAFGTNNGRHGKGKYPLARLVALCLANTMTVLGYNLGSYATDETALLWPLLTLLRKGDLLVADRRFAAAHYYARYQAHGLEFLTRVHQRLKVSRLTRVVSYAVNDFIADMPINPAQRKKDPSLPTSVRVRLIQASVRIRGKRQTVWFVTSLLDAERYPAAEIVELYADRWRIETLFRNVKINLSADVLRSRTAEGIRKEVSARFVAVNIVRMIILEAAAAHDVDPMRVSFVHAVRTILAFAPSFAREPIWKLPELYGAMLREIASRLVPDRPGRLEPRAVRRERKHYPTLKTTRKEWKEAHAA